MIRAEKKLAKIRREIVQRACDWTHHHRNEYCRAGWTA